MRFKKPILAMFISMIFTFFIFSTNYEEKFKIIRKGNITEIIKLLKKDPEIIRKRPGSFGWTALLHAVASKKIKTVRFLVEQGADIDQKSKNGRSPLTYAVVVGAPDILAFLLKKNAKYPINGKPGIRLVHRAAKKGYRTLVSKMIEKGVDIKAKDSSGNTLLHSAAIGGINEIVNLLIDRGVDVNLRNNYTITPLHLAALNGKLDIVKSLISRGADIDKKTHIGKRAIHFALDNKHSQIVDFLLSKGADKKNDGFPLIKGDYLGQRPSKDRAEIFGLGIISSMTEEHGICVFSTDGNEVYWPKKSMTEYNSAIYRMRRVNNIWQKPEILPLNKGYMNANPSISFDSNVLYYSNNAPINRDGSMSSDMNIWYIKREGKNWSKPILSDSIINTIYYEGGSYIAKDGSLYFISSREGGEGSLDLYVSIKKNGKFCKPRNLGKPVNSKYFDAYPYVSNKNDYLIFESYRPGGFGNGDLFISFKKDGKWGNPKNMGPKINTKEGRETFPMVSPDGKFFFFSSSRRGNLDAYWIDAKIIDSLR